jgi:hypothetical protein
VGETMKSILLINGQSQTIFGGLNWLEYRMLLNILKKKRRVVNVKLRGERFNCVIIDEVVQ